MDAIWSNPQGGSKSLNFFDLLKHLLLQWLCCLMTVASDTAYANMVASKCWLSRYIRISPYGDDSLSWRAMRGVGGGRSAAKFAVSATLHSLHIDTHHVHEAPPHGGTLGNTTTASADDRFQLERMLYESKPKALKWKQRHRIIEP